MDIERLRALEKDIRNSGGPGCQYHADQLASLIAEIGQEVGAVEPVGYMDPDADFMLPRKGQCVLSSHVVLVRDPHGKYTRPLYTSPAHTSEARDAYITDLLILIQQHLGVGCVAQNGYRSAHNRLAVEIETTLRNAEDAAMRQEGGTP